VPIKVEHGPKIPKLCDLLESGHFPGGFYIETGIERENKSAASTLNSEYPSIILVKAAGLKTCGLLLFRLGS